MTSLNHLAAVKEDESICQCELGRGLQLEEISPVRRRLEAYGSVCVHRSFSLLGQAPNHPHGH